MPVWILILVLVGPKGDAVQIESVAVPFTSYEACNDAGVRARTLPVLTAPGAAFNRIDWVCVPATRREP